MKALFISLQRNLHIISLKVIHQFLIDNKHDSTLLYLNRFSPANHVALENLRAFLEGQHPDIIGLSLTSLEYPSARSLTALLKEWFPEIPVIWGGMHPTIAPEMCVEYADFVCVGEGEYVMLDIANAIERGEPLHSIGNLCYLKDGSVHANPLRPLEKNLDVFPILTQIPPHSFIQAETAVEPLTIPHLKKYKLFRGGFYRTVNTRGCPMHCTYCCNNHLISIYPGWGLRWRSVEHIMTELERAMKEGPVSFIAFSDDCLLGCSLDYLKEFCAQYKARIGLPFLAKSTPAYITKERMDLMVDAGLALLSVGMQAGSDRVCAEVYKRPVRKEDFLRIARLIQEYTVAPYYDIIVDNPFETVEEDYETVEAVMATARPFFLNIFSLTFFRGTELRARVERECPEKLGDSEAKDFSLIEKTPINDLKLMAAYLHRPIMRRLVSMHKRKPDAALTRLAIAAGRAYTRWVLIPITLMRLLRRMHRGSTWRTLCALPRMLDVRVCAGNNVFQQDTDSTFE
jgi:radical SAM superfamily enzyme YgiQ (UPF0313 family)